MRYEFAGVDGEPIVYEGDAGQVAEFVERRVNMSSPNDEGFGTSYNTWMSADTCEQARVDVHSRTSM